MSYTSFQNCTRILPSLDERTKPPINRPGKNHYPNHLPRTHTSAARTGFHMKTLSLQNHCTRIQSSCPPGRPPTPQPGLTTWQRSYTLNSHNSAQGRTRFQPRTTQHYPPLRVTGSTSSSRRWCFQFWSWVRQRRSSAPSHPLVYTIKTTKSRHGYSTIANTARKIKVWET